RDAGTTFFREPSYRLRRIDFKATFPGSGDFQGRENRRGVWNPGLDPRREETKSKRRQAAGAMEFGPRLEGSKGVRMENLRTNR
ncbi:MAG TPA: hypothetical protein PLX50_05160, partial [Candidatus Aminicenantes bacterium]|nr:hypothetical protein [Candidatus Aminicenantes bacterium]